MEAELFSLGEAGLDAYRLVSLSYKKNPLFKISDERWKVLRQQRKT